MTLFVIFSEDKSSAASDYNDTEQVTSETISGTDNIAIWENIKPRNPPTPKPINVLGELMSAGYKKQPRRENYAEIGDSITLYTDADRSVFSKSLNWLARPTYQWYFLPHLGTEWIKIPKDEGGNDKNIKISLYDEKKWRFYQQQVTWNTLPFTTIYSNLAFVSFVAKHISATKIEAGIEDPYLYINGSSYAHVDVTPYNSTGKITWSGSNDSLARVDPETGLITANNNGMIGKLTITATINNTTEDGKQETLSDSFEVEVGKGLDPQTVKSGQTATFRIRGDIDPDQATITWYKVQDSKTTQVATGGVTYTTPKTKLTDNGSQYYAVVKINERSNSKSITTNNAELKVQAVGSPKIDMIDTIHNQTYSDNTNNDLNTSLDNVSGGDVINIESTMNNNSEDSSLDNGNFVMPLYENMTVQRVLIDDKIVDLSRYKTENNTLEIDQLNFLGKESHTVKITATMGNTKKGSFTTTPFIKGTDSDGNFYLKNGTPLSMNLIDNFLTITVNNIDYGVHHFVQRDQIVDRVNHNDEKDPIIEADDQRRKIGEASISVSQNEYFRNTKDKNIILPASLRYYYDDGSFVDLSNNDASVARFEEGEKVKPIYWKKSEGLRLYFNSSDIQPGQYHTTLSWTVSYSL
ncbi:Ig-like domain-containing protein [Companilactobacillus kedongensis]|uniref:Ig-like domain-containing protein n=1 Tax=Companilactobacillus kedongensis TaxID=2486004 RepID=UPI0013DDA350|nr:Ig-like domain-containing protein [Companilactobacillus kedongensis]